MQIQMPQQTQSIHPPPRTSGLQIIEWRFNQFLGEKLQDEEMNQEENQSYFISEVEISNNGQFVVLGDHGGRVIIFKKANRI